MAGRVLLKIVYQLVRRLLGLAQVELTIPEGFKAEIDAQIPALVLTVPTDKLPDQGSTAPCSRSRPEWPGSCDELRTQLGDAKTRGLST